MRHVGCSVRAVRVVPFVLVLVACGASPQSSTLATHTSGAPGTDASDARPALGDVRWIEVGAPVRDVSASARRIAAIVDDGSVVSFDLSSGARAVVRPADPAAPPTMPSLSPDGTLIALCVGTELSIIDVERGTYGVLDRESECVGPALWAPDGHRLYALLRGPVIVAIDLSNGAHVARVALPIEVPLVASSGEVVIEGDHAIDVRDAALGPIAHYVMPTLAAQHDSPGTSFVLAMIDRSTFVYACGEANYDVTLVHDGQSELLWSSAHDERWSAALALAGERAFVLVERDQATSARVIEARTGRPLAEIPDVTRPIDVAADGSIAVATAATRLAVIGVQ